MNFDIDWEQQWTAIKQSFIKLDPTYLIKNPVLFVVEICTILTIILTFYPPLFNGQEPIWYYSTITFILIFTLLFANYAESLAALQGEAHADSLRALQVETDGKRLKEDMPLEDITEDDYEVVPSDEIQKGDIVFVDKGDIIPRDGSVIEGSASVDESAITGESEPVIRESGGDRNSVTEGTEVLSDKIKVEVTAEVGESFLDRMIGLVETASRQKTPNEISMTLLLASFTFIYLAAVVTMRFFGMYIDMDVDVANLIALLIGLMPTTIGALLASIRIAGMTRVTRENIIAKSGKAVESAGDLDTLILDKTGTITTGERIAEDFIAIGDEDEEELFKACLQSSYFDETPEGRSIVNLAHDKGVDIDESEIKKENFVEFSAKSRMSGIDLPNGTEIRKGAVEAVKEYANETPEGLTEKANEIADNGGTPLAVSVDKKILGLIELQDELKLGIKERIKELQEMGVETIMATGDNERTARYVAKQAGIDEYYAEFKPEEKIDLVEKIQKEGKLIGMTGDGTNDAPALAKADVGLAMQAGTNAAKEAGNMVDLDSDPTKLIEVVAVGKQLLMTRGSLTTFSIANDVSRYFALVPAIFSAGIPSLQHLNILSLHSPQSVVIASLIYNSLIIPFLIPLAMKGVNYQAESSAKLLRKNLFMYGGAGLIAPFISIKLIDLLLVTLGVF
ncbi:MAG: potassium-transporting ATPase subunit KdpB [Halanaerobiales bacterium]|nr:potassium-transporting ATPase subunit KdpB [Halanaerobiales bacterium]